jgi:hypothetical protein
MPCSRLKWVLAQSARWHARQAVRMHVSEEPNELLQAATSTGTSVELLAKAYLSIIDPALLADKGDRNTILLLSGNSALTGAEPTGMKTITAYEALRAIKQLRPDFPLVQQDDPLLQVRNAACHMALVSPGSLSLAVMQMCRIVEALLLALNLDRPDFWGAHAMPVVDTLLDKAKTEIARAVAAKMAAAIERFTSLLTGLSETDRNAVLAVLSAGPLGTIADDEVVERAQCPACGQQGWLTCLVRPGSESADQISVAAGRIAYPFQFRCLVCKLVLGNEELNEFNFPDQIELIF